MTGPQIKQVLYMERRLNPGHQAPAAVFLSTLQGEPCDQGPFLLYYFMRLYVSLFLPGYTDISDSSVYLPV